jgi:hypothetical protein
VGDSIRGLDRRTSIRAVGTVVLGIVYFKESGDLHRLVSISLIVGLRISSSADEDSYGDELPSVRTLQAGAHARNTHRKGWSVIAPGSLTRYVG